MAFKHNLGIEVEAMVTGARGVIVSRSECLYGCNRYYVQPKADKDMKVPDGWWIDEDDLRFVSAGIKVEPKTTGGMMSKIR